MASAYGGGGNRLKVRGCYFQRGGQEGLFLVTLVLRLESREQTRQHSGEMPSGAGRQQVQRP